MQTTNKVITTTEELAELLNEVMTVLEQEQRALQDTTTETVVTVTSRKRALLQQINHVHPDLVHRVTGAGGADNEPQAVAQIRRLLALCQRYNKENAALVTHSLHMCRRSMNFLQGSLQQNSIERYNPDGQTTSGVRSREIGTA